MSGSRFIPLEFITVLRNHRERQFRFRQRWVRGVAPLAGMATLRFANPEFLFGEGTLILWISPGLYSIPARTRGPTVFISICFHPISHAGDDGRTVKS